MALTAEQEGLSDIWRGGKQVDMASNSSSVQKAVVGSARGSQASQPNVLRTVYLPNEKVGQIKNENDRLNMQIQQQRAEHERLLM